MTSVPKFKKSFAQKKGSLKPKAVALSQRDWVKTSFPVEGSTLPLMVEPAIKSVDLCSWIRANPDFLDDNLLSYGGILFRGFGLEGDAGFKQVLESLPWPLLNYMEGATPRLKLGKRIYTSTEFPPEESIALHNELNYVTTWPTKIFFYSSIPAEEGGETPIADVRRVYKRLPEEIRRPFEEKGWLLIRNFGDGFGPDWRTSYHVETREEAEEYFKKADISWEWKDGDRLRTRQVRPTVARHIKTNEMVWFNHVAFWHVSSLRPEIREVFAKEYSDEDLPYSTYYGDGSPIEDSVIAALRDAYDQETIAFPWQEGDFLVLDNVLVAHGRKPFKGERKTLTAMADPCSDRNL